MITKNKRNITLIFVIILFFGNYFAIAEEINKEDLAKKAYQYFDDQLNFTTNAAGVKKVVDGKVKNVHIIDVRAAKHFKVSRIPGSINIPFDKFNGFEGNKCHDNETDFSGLTREGYNYVLCYEENCNLSQKACKKFASSGYLVKEVKGGFKSWQDHNYPIDNK